MPNLHSLILKNIHINDSYWNRYIQLISDVVLPYQWDILNDKVPDVPPSHCLRNFKIAAGEAEGERLGTVFLDSDAAKWLEAVAYSLNSRPDKKLEKTADDVIALIGRAQCDDGYLNTYYTLAEPGERWRNLTAGHELYCAGHFIEAGVAYYEATGKSQLLNIVRRFADLIYDVFGPAENQIHGYPGHPEIELALIRLYKVTNEKKYASLAKYFIDTRGSTPNYFLQEMSSPNYKILYPEFSPYDPSYSQSHKPVLEQDTAEGHAVRAVYLYCAMADLAELYGDENMREQCEKLWNNIVKKRMYITGGIGSSGLLERFTTDYDLPNDCNYSETCASIGLALFGLRMSRLTQNASYIDIVERALYNTVRAGISLEGDRYFYVNPLEVWPDACMDHTSKSHVKPTRQRWFDVACCPTNVARTFTSLGQYIYSAGDKNLFVNLYIQNSTELELNGLPVKISLSTDYPRSGNVSVKIDTQDNEFALGLRIPGFANGEYSVLINGEKTSASYVNGYCVINRVWNNDQIELCFPIRPQLVYANPAVRANSGKVAILRGPEVYCFEEADNGDKLSSIYLDTHEPLIEKWNDDLLGGTMLIHCKGQKLQSWNEEDSYRVDKGNKTEKVSLTAIPYGFWNNRQDGEMIVWLHQL